MELIKKFGKYKWLIGLIKETSKEDRNNLIAGYKSRKQYYTSPIENMEADLKGMTKCSTCPNMCRFDCPAVLTSKKETYSPANKARIALFMGMNRVPMDNPSAIKTMYACMNCDACLEWCPMNLSAGELLTSMRSELEKRDLIPESLHHLKTRVESVGSVIEKSPFTADSEFNINMEKPEIFYYIGCVSAEHKPEMVRANIAILKHLGVKFATHFESRQCCGSPLYKVGYKSVALKQATQNQEVIKNSKVKIVITDCPACAAMLGETYEKFEVKIKPKILHTSVYFDELIQKGTLNPTKEIKHVVTYHDPCILARKSKHITEVRNIFKKIPGLELKEAYLHNNETRCCGYGGGYHLSNPELCDQISSERLSQLRKHNADYIVSACPTCELSLLNAKKAGPENKDVIKDFSEILAESLGLEF
jgi:Fe-S oxidoreductase